MAQIREELDAITAADVRHMIWTRPLDGGEVITKVAATLDRMDARDRAEGRF